MTSSPKRERSLDSEGKEKSRFEEMSKSKYISLYTKTRVANTLQSLDLSVDPTLEGERQSHNKQSSISMWTMEENIEKLRKHGKTFENGSLFRS